jgi:hypothetical protein
MTSLNLVQPYIVNSLIPIHYASHASQVSPWTMSNFRKAYTGLNSFLSWGEKLSGPQTAPFFSEHRQILSMQSSAFAIPGWFERTFKLSHDIAEIRASMRAGSRNQAIQKIAFTSIDLTNASIGVAQCLNDVHLIDLSAISPVLPGALKGLTSIGGLALKVNELYQKYVKSYLHSGKTESRGLSIHQKADKNDVWKVLGVIRDILGLVGAIIAVIVFFFSLPVSPYLILFISTFIFISSLAADLHASLSN